MSYARGYAMLRLRLPQHQFQTTLGGVRSHTQTGFKLHKEDIYVCIKQFRNESYIGDFLILSETAN